uniref:Uncharacterized protein n=1 Tax=Arundo donax TaxID=35708 RepID=A0A0A9DXT0_ARUDO
MDRRTRKRSPSAVFGSSASSTVLSSLAAMALISPGVAATPLVMTTTLWTRSLPSTAAIRYATKPP